MSLHNPLRLDELLNYRLARLLSLSSAPGIRLFEGGYSVSRREWSLVCLLAEHGGMSPSALADVAHLERAKVSRALTELVSKGLVVRRPAPHDGRRAMVELTSDGLQMHKEVFPQIVRLSQAVVSALSPQQLTVFDEALAALTVAAQALVRSAPVKLKAARHLGESRRSRQVHQP